MLLYRLTELPAYRLATLVTERQPQRWRIIPEHANRARSTVVRFDIAPPQVRVFSLN
jgi:hypothetical protein